MAEQKIIISIQVNSGEAAKTNKALKVTKDNFEKLTKAEKEAIVADKQLSLAAKQLDKDLTNQASAANAAAAATDNMRATSGLNNAIIMETSRLASDASFGFTAIANNLSQLVNLVQSNVKATGSFKSAISGLFTAQAAFLVGIQLLITYGDDLYKMFLKNSSAAIDLFKVFKDAGAEVSSTSGKFETYIRTLQDSNKSQEEQRKAVNALNKEFPDYISQLERADLTLEDVANKTEEATKQNDLYRESLKKLALARAAQNKIEEESAAIIQANINFEDELRKLEASGAKDADGIPGFSMKDAELSITAYKDAFDQISKMNLTTQEKEDELNRRKRENRQIASGEYLSSLYDELQEETKIRDENIQRLVKYTIIETDTEEGGQGNRKRNFKQYLLDLEKLEESYRQKAIDTQMMTAEEIINEQEKNAIKELDIRRDAFIKKQEQRLEEFKESTDNAEEIAKAEAEVNESKRLAQVEHDEVMIELTDAFNTKRTQLIRKRNEDDAKEQERADDILKQYLDGRIETQKTFEEESNELYYNANENRIQQDMDFIAKRIELETDDVAVRAELQTQFYSLQDELRQNDLERELSSIEAKKNVNMEYVGFAEQTGSLLEKLGNRSKALANVALAVEKGAAIAKVIVSAQASIAAKTASANAIPAFLPPFGTPNPSFLVAQAEAKASNTRTKISAALSIANILASLIGKKGAPKDTSGGGGTGGGINIQAPDFNVVGASQTSQLAQAVTEQQAKPVKAFVVGKDISTQQELDRNITNTASFG